MPNYEMLENGNLRFRIPISVKNIGSRRRVIAEKGMGNDEQPVPIAVHLARAFRWRKMLDDGIFVNSRELAAAAKLDRSYVDRTLRLTLLAPDIVHAILENTASEQLSLDLLRRNIPAQWDEQRKLLVNS